METVRMFELFTSVLYSGEVSQGLYGSHEQAKELGEEIAGFPPKGDDFTTWFNIKEVDIQSGATLIHTLDKNKHDFVKLLYMDKEDEVSIVAVLKPEGEHYSFAFLYVVDNKNLITTDKKITLSPLPSGVLKSVYGLFKTMMFEKNGQKKFEPEEDVFKEFLLS